MHLIPNQNNPLNLLQKITKSPIEISNQRKIGI